jgi:hypothetical protein
MEEIRQTQNFTVVGLLAIKLQNYRYGVPRSTIAELVDCRKNLSASIGDKNFGQIATNLIVVVDSLIGYATAINNGDKVTATKLMRHAEHQWAENDKVIEEVLKNV